MTMIKSYDIDNERELTQLGKAISSPERVKIIRLLGSKSNLSISDISKILNIPQSSVAFHLKLLEEAGIIRMQERPGRHGISKLCTRKVDLLNIRFMLKSEEANEIFSLEMQVGNFIDCHVFPTCGLFSKDGVIGMEDHAYSFFLPERQKAGLIWSSRGDVVYRFANKLYEDHIPKEIIFSLEICSEAPGYNEKWKSDITFWVNDIECTTWTCPGDFGRMRGRLNPPNWVLNQSQYGELVTLAIRKDGCYFNKKKVSEVTIENLFVNKRPFIDLKIGNKEDAEYVGGFNIFGKDFGNYEQGIVMIIQYE